ncbi:MAG: acetyltransferase [Gammaproteobacteria bacterium]|nr:acetyltransferase [Gammaproteobacteria bacterium]
MGLHFEKVTQQHINIIFTWLAQDFVSEFWDNTQAHKDDILNFAAGRKVPSNYADGKYHYWIASFNHEPFAMFMTIQETHKDCDIGQEKLSLLSKSGNTYSLEYLIGNPQYWGKGYGAKTLSEFIYYFREYVDPKGDTFWIDPATDNPRATPVYMKAGFKHAADFIMKGECSGRDKYHHWFIRKFEPKISIYPITIEDYPLVQNMARFYVYDLSRKCGNLSSDWSLPENGLYESFDFKNYFTDPLRKVYLVKVYDELAGFALLNQATEDPSNTWNMGEFFIIAKFQGQGIATRVAHKIWEITPGRWEIPVIPENKKALIFWEKAITKFTDGAFDQTTKEVTYDEHQPKRVIFAFDTSKSRNLHSN